MIGFRNFSSDSEICLPQTKVESISFRTQGRCILVLYMTDPCDKQAMEPKACLSPRAVL